MVNSKKVLAALPVPKKKGSEKRLPEKVPIMEKVPIVEEFKGTSHGKGKGKTLVSFVR